MDVGMVLLLAVFFAAFYVFAEWCEREERDES